ncbi:MAG: UDP-glucose 6-dehydrogenase [Bdellovibrio sp. CG10_big_fil_rev_8_21_14_0_10_47_8]|nr:MAG: UDP-glucose 6-dehydrogenase [Bdellovibrio sp. CG10_big_fil_rev_8_21_14_0_10_47_8]
MKISVFGTGYVGLVTGVCFAEMGNDVICVDIDPKKVSMLKEGKSPIYEPGLDQMITGNLKARRIEFTTDSKRAVETSDLLFIAVGTPSDVDGSADLQYVLQVAETIATHMNEYKVVVTKSTVPVGTGHKVKAMLEKTLKSRGAQHTFDVVSNPEFLREGAAIEDCLKPSRVVVGCESSKAGEIMTRLYDPFLKSGNPMLVMDILSSEMTKYAANSMLATKISLMNEFSRVCEKVGADIEQVRRGIGSDFRIGPHFIFAGVGYGGSCFPKDVKALIKAGKDQGEEMEILDAVESTNQLQRENFLHRIKKSVGGSFRGQKVAVWGVAFKPGTDDIREAPALDLIQGFLDDGAHVSVFDPVAAENAREHFGNLPQLKFFDDQYQVLEGASCLVIVTEWKSFKEPNFERMRGLMSKALIHDGRNLFNPKTMSGSGFEYHSIGRPLVKANVAKEKNLL